MTLAMQINNLNKAGVRTVQVSCLYLVPYKSYTIGTMSPSHNKDRTVLVLLAAFVAYSQSAIRWIGLDSRFDHRGTYKNLPDNRR